MIVIPAIDLLGGTAVRLRQGRYDSVTAYDRDPADIARDWREHVARLHVVDLDGARDGRPIQMDTVRRIVDAFGPGVQVGGGVRSRDAVERYFECGAERVVLGTSAVRDPDFVRRAANDHPRAIIVAVDAREGRVATEGWLDDGGVLAIDLARDFARHPIAGVLYTDIDRDGTEVGPNFDATETLARDAGTLVIASGGVGTLEHLRELARRAERAPALEAVIVGRALHERRFTLADAVLAAAEHPAAS